MNQTVQESLEIFALHASPSAEQTDRLLRGWENYFRCLAIDEGTQPLEFKGIMRARTKESPYGVTNLQS